MKSSSWRPWGEKTIQFLFDCADNYLVMRSGVAKVMGTFRAITTKYLCVLATVGSGWEDKKMFPLTCLQQHWTRVCIIYELSSMFSQLRYWPVTCRPTYLMHQTRKQNLLASVSRLWSSVSTLAVMSVSFGRPAGDEKPSVAWLLVDGSAFIHSAPRRDSHRPAHWVARAVLESAVFEAKPYYPAYRSHLQ